MFWQITGFPPCSHHAFLSHSQEDRESLVLPVQKALQDCGLVTWLDRDDYSYGRSSRDALRHGILCSRHVVFFVTDAMLASPRGWCVLELALAELLESNMQISGGQLANIALPLFLVPQDDPRLPRSVWQVTRDRGHFHRPTHDGSAVEWCQQEVAGFLERERQLSDQLLDQTKRDKLLAKQIKSRPGLFERVTANLPLQVG